MKFEIWITDLTEAGLKSLVKYLEKRQEVSNQVDAGLKVWEGKRKKAPYGLKKDGTPAKKRGRPPIKLEF